jgi:hypothetical protein
MIKLKLETQIFIDGFIADINGNTDWIMWNRSPDLTWDKELQKLLLHRSQAMLKYQAHNNTGLNSI